MDIREIRRNNLKQLMDEAFGTGARGAQSRLAERLGKPQNFISRCLAEPGKPGAKTIGEDFAREIEKHFNLDDYDLDKPLRTKKIAFDQLIFSGPIDLKGISEATTLASEKLSTAQHQLVKNFAKQSFKERESLAISLAQVRANWQDLNAEQKAESAKRLLGPIQHPLATISLLVAICDAVTVGAFSEDEISALTKMVNARRNHHVHHDGHMTFTAS